MASSSLKFPSPRWRERSLITRLDHAAGLERLALLYARRARPCGDAVDDLIAAVGLGPIQRFVGAAEGSLQVAVPEGRDADAHRDPVAAAPDVEDLGGDCRTKAFSDAGGVRHVHACQDRAEFLAAVAGDD